MPTILCDCGSRFPAIPGGTCPQCGKGPPKAEATAVCGCGEVHLGSALWIYREITCEKCAREFEMCVPEEGTLAVVTRAESGARVSPARWAFLAFLIPLFLLLLKPDDIEKRIAETAKDHPRVKRLLEMEEDPDEVLAELPGRKIAGAWLPRDSTLPWAMTFLAVGAFAVSFRFLVPAGRATWKQLGLVALFTGTAGIFALLSLQGVAFSGEGGILLVFAIMYLLALHPAVGFAGKLIGFTLGVGLLEEGVKAIPLVWRFGSGNSRLDIRGAAAWGIASGAGFGLSEALHYSLDMYNGLFPASIYLVRFASCVALHGAWAGTSAILMWKWQSELSDVWWKRIRALAFALIGPMLLHGLYDALLSKEHEILATLVALGSLAWFLWLYGRADRIEARVVGLAA
ncbi:MAG: PrsW family glutamic-type intramembrane protease [Planctomycetota bacterium]